MPISHFAKYETKNYPYRFHARLHVDTLVGGTPMSEKAIEGWIKTKMDTRDEQLRAMVAEVMVETGVDADEAAEELASKIGLCGFKTDDEGLYIEGRQVKSMLREACGIARAADRLPAKYGTTNKSVIGYSKEHIFVVEDKIHLGVTEPTGVNQRFIHKVTRQGAVSAFLTEQYVEHAEIGFTVESDHKFSDDEWAAIWLTAERNGLGASRSQGFGRFTVVEWEPLP